jgi:hypothetical protein
VEFILVSVPLFLLTLSVIAIAINGFAKNIAQDVAVDTARFAALADQNAQLATERSYRSLGVVLVRVFNPLVLVSREDSSSRCAYEVSVTLKPLVLGFFSNISPIRESASAVCELQG